MSWLCLCVFLVGCAWNTSRGNKQGTRIKTTSTDSTWLVRYYACCSMAKSGVDLDGFRQWKPPLVSYMVGFVCIFFQPILCGDSILSRFFLLHSSALYHLLGSQAWPTGYHLTQPSFGLYIWFTDLISIIWNPSCGMITWIVALKWTMCH